MTRIQHTDAEWQDLLARKNAEAVAFAVTRQAATERPFTGRYEDHWAAGTYRCICCGATLFHSDTKFDAGAAGPAFSRPPTRRPSKSGATSATAWCGSKPCAPNAALTWAMCLKTALRPQGFATA